MSYKKLLNHYKNKAISCRSCKGNAIPIVYGTPGGELLNVASDGIVHLAGCLVPSDKDKNTHLCTNCKKEIKT